MADPRLSKILIGVLILGIMSLGFMLFLSEGANNYNAEGYSNSTLESFYTDSQEIEDIANNAKDNLSTTGAQDNGFDIFGSFFSNAWTALKSTWNSMTTINKLGNNAVDGLPFINSQFSKQLRVFLTTVVIIILVIAVFFHFIKPSNRL